MTLKRQLSSIPAALREILEKGRPEYEALIRQVRWGDSTLFATGSGASVLAAQTAAYAFESIAGWPVVVRPAHELRAYTMASVRPRSVLLAISQSGATAETLEAAEAARRRGATVLAVTENAESPLAKMAQGLLLVRTGEERDSPLVSMVCQQSALSYAAVLASRLLKRPEKHIPGIEADLEKLPEQAEWIVTQLHGVFRAFAAELQGSAGFPVVAGGFYRPVATAWALLVRTLCRMNVEVWDAGEFSPRFLRLEEGKPLVMISGSRCRTKKAVHQVVNTCRLQSPRILSVTDSADRELTEFSSLAVLLPAVSEPAGSALAFILLAAVASEMTPSLGT